MRKIGLFFMLLCPILLFSCRHKQQETPEETIEYPVSIIADTLRADLSDNTELYPLSEEFLESFLEKAHDYQGHKVMAKVDLPQEWGIRCVERLPEGKELWLVQSQSREWLYLVITSGFGTQRILDLIPAAVNVAN